MKKILGLGAAALVIPAAAVASAVLIHPATAVAQPGADSSVNVVGEQYIKAVSILKGLGVKQRFNGSVTGPGGVPQSQCVVDQQRSTSAGVMLLHLDCTAKAAEGAADNAPAPKAVAPGGPAPGAGQGTYGGPIGVPVPVG